MNSVRSNNPSFKSQRFTPSGCKDIWMNKFELWQRLNSFANFKTRAFSKKSIKQKLLEFDYQAISSDVLNKFQYVLHSK